MLIRDTLKITWKGGKNYKTIKWRNLLYARFVSIVIFESAYFPLCRYNKRKTAVAIYELQQPLLFNFIDDFSKNDLSCAWVDIIHSCHPLYAVWWDHLLVKPVWQRIHRGEKDDRQFDDQTHRRLPQLWPEHRVEYEFPPILPRYGGNWEYTKYGIIVYPPVHCEQAVLHVAILSCKGKDLVLNYRQKRWVLL